MGIESITGAGGIHEHNIDFTGPETPEIVATSIENNAQDVSVSDSLQLSFDVPQHEAVSWNFEIDPPVEYEIIEVSDQQWEIKFAQELQQDTTYKLLAERTVVQKDLETGSILSQFDPAVALNLEFKTTTPPLLESVSPSGDGALLTEALKVQFKDSLIQDSVENSFSLKPEIAGTFEWVDEKTFTFTPTDKWKAETKYTMELAAGIQANDGGFTEDVITNSFTTIGKVRVTEFDPKNGTGNVNVKERVAVRFDQPVDRKSAEGKFSISPNLAGKIEWNDNSTRLVFVPSNGLGYSTKYTVKVASGVKSKHGQDSAKEFTASFTTQSEIFMLNVPWYSQQERFTCNVASTRMALAYRGVYKNEADIKSGLGIGPSLNGTSGGDPYVDWIDGYGTYWTNVSDYVSGYRKTSIKRNWNITELLTEVSKGNPSILWWQNGWSDWYTKSWTTSGGKQVQGLNGMHSEVVIGYKGSISNPSQIITRDPWRGTRYYDRAYFEQLWTNSFNRTAVVVY